jgi:hypothetical protein
MVGFVPQSCRDSRPRHVDRHRQAARSRIQPGSFQALRREQWAAPLLRKIELNGGILSAPSLCSLVSCRFVERGTPTRSSSNEREQVARRGDTHGSTSHCGARRISRSDGQTDKAAGQKLAALTRIPQERFARRAGT